MSIVVPAVMPTGDEPQLFHDQMDRLGLLGRRVQIDLMDGDFAPHHNTDPSDIWWPEGSVADIHLMYRYPREAVRELIEKRPSLIILHVEIEDDVLELLHVIHEAGIQAGVALLRTTPVEENRRYIEQADHVLLFAGELGGDGTAELSVLDKVSEVRAIKPGVEVGWDGGANETNIHQLVAGGVDVINVGGALRKAETPRVVFDRLVSLAR
jgi:ribulose-phosphate 3-epimerase